jgi:hypothetical protein
VIVLYPEALNQHPFALDLRTLTHELLLLIIWLPVAGVAFLMMLWVLMIYKAFAGQVSLEVAIRASLRVGLAVYLFVPLYQMPFLLFGPGDAAAITGLSLDGLILTLGIMAAMRVVRCARIKVTI